MKLLFTHILFILFACSYGAFAQNTYVTLPDAPKKTIKKFEKAKEISMDFETEKRKSKLQAITEDSPILVDAVVELAKIAYLQKDFDKAVELMTLAITNAPEYKPEYYNILAGICKAKEDYACEKENLQKYIDNDIPFKKVRKTELRLNELRQIEMIVENAEPVELHKLSFNINSEEYPEYKPVLSTNDSTIIFTRRMNGQEDFYQSELTEKGWSKAEPVIELNTPGNEGAHAISPNGKYIIFTRCDAPNRYRSCDLYISSRKEATWSEPKYLAITNTEAWESQAAFSPDGKTVYFSSSREGGQGGKDLYSISNDNGKWGQVVNLGEPLNTKGNEESPYMHPDGRTLYFMSTGHAGLGGHDLFVSNMRLDGSWTKPINMGPSINSPKDEGGIFVDLAGNYAYFSKTEKTDSGLTSDIYRFELPRKFKPKPVNYVKIKVKDAATKQAMTAEVRIVNTDNGAGKTLNISIEGLIEILNPDTNYSFTVEKDGYIFYSESFKPVALSQTSEALNYVVELLPIPTVTEEPSAEIVLRNIYFSTGKSNLLASSYPELDRLTNLLKVEKELNILIIGHTDDVGSEQDNLLLSANRAKAVQEYLINQGINGIRIQTKALGESQPIATNDTEEGRSKNRRISFILQ